jgi:hypothetical protein
VTTPSSPPTSSGSDRGTWLVLVIAVVVLGIVGGAGLGIGVLLGSHPASRTSAPSVLAPATPTTPTAQPSAPATSAPPSAVTRPVAVASTKARPAGSSGSGLTVGYFAGGWSRHGEALIIGASGHGTMTFRTYRWCSQEPAPPCDALVGDSIDSGGHAAFVLTTIHASGPTADGTLTTTNEPVPVGVPVTMAVNTRDSAGPTSVTVTGLDGRSTVYCSDRTPGISSGCGA